MREDVVDLIKADTFSLAAFEIGLFGWMAIVVLVIFGTTWHANPAEPVFWFMMHRHDYGPALGAQAGEDFFQQNFFQGPLSSC
jgi:hypothetical protein